VERRSNYGARASVCKSLATAMCKSAFERRLLVMKTRVMLLALCLGCSRGSGIAADSEVADHAQVAERLKVRDAKLSAAATMGMVRAEAAPSAPEAQPTNDASENIDFSDARKLVRNVELRIQVENVVAAMAHVDTTAHTFGAMIADSHASRDPNGRGDGRVVVRVPAPKLDALLTDLRAIGKVQDEQTSTDDITKQFTDLETRIVVKGETVSRLRALLATRTGKLSDVIDLERELSRTIAELEQMKGERRFYEQEVAMSTVTIALVEPNVIIASGVSTSAGDALQHSLELLHASALTVIYTFTFLAPWLPLLGAAWWLFARFRPRRASRVTPDAAPVA
jgi:hypothetical protein